MFSGLIQCIGTVKNIQDSDGKRLLTITVPTWQGTTEVGDSIAINGVCLTVVELAKNQFSFDVIPQTLAATNLGQLTENSKVNVESSLRYGDEIGGHMVQGHVDMTTEIIDRVTTGDAWQVSFVLPQRLRQQVVSKGYVAIDGTSLTVQSCAEQQFTVALIPHTRSVTISQYYQTGAMVNLETDFIGKQIIRYLGDSPWKI